MVVSNAAQPITPVPQPQAQQVVKQPVVVQPQVVTTPQPIMQQPVANPQFVQQPIQAQVTAPQVAVNNQSQPIATQNQQTATTNAV